MPGNERYFSDGNEGGAEGNELELVAARSPGVMNVENICRKNKRQGRKQVQK